MNQKTWIHQHKQQFEQRGQTLLVRAPAKVNLSLLIGEKRPDGFHELETIMTRVSLYDEIRFEPAEKSYTELLCDGPYAIAPSPDNLVLKADNLIREQTGIEKKFRIRLTKNIPVGAGLAGGSTDAAATLIALNKLLDANLDNSRLSTLAASLGSDIPFFIGPPLAICSGRGEKVKKISQYPPQNYLIFIPDISVPTKEVYRNFKPKPNRFRQLKSEISGILKKNRVDLGPEICANMLEESCFQLFPQLETIKNRIRAMKLGTVLLSGSGSCFFCLLENDNKYFDHKQLEQASGCKCINVVNNRW